MFGLDAFFEPGFGFMGPGRLFAGLGLGGARGGELEHAADFGAVEIEQELAGERFHFAAANLDRDTAAVGEDFKIGEGILDITEAGAEGGEDQPDAFDADAVAAEFAQSAEGDEFAEAVFAGRGDESVLFPTGENALAHAQKAEHLIAGE